MAQFTDDTGLQQLPSGAPGWRERGLAEAGQGQPQASPGRGATALGLHRHAIPQECRCMAWAQGEGGETPQAPSPGLCPPWVSWPSQRDHAGPPGPRQKSASASPPRPEASTLLCLQVHLSAGLTLGAGTQDQL